MTTTTSIPRFLLPQRGLIWRRVPATLTTPAGGGRVLLRFASSTSNSTAAPKKPLILEKPERFNPPSHGSRLPKRTNPRHYGGELAAEELAQQKVKDYPGMPPPKGSFGHRFWHNPWIHSIFSLSALTALAAWTFTENFKRNSPYYDMVPSWGDLFYHPITSTRQLSEVIKLNSAYNAARTQEKRQRRIDDVAKRTAYRKAHGLTEEMGFFDMKSSTSNKKEDVEAKPAAASDPTEDGGVPAGTAR